VEPPYLEVTMGDSVEFRCHATGSGSPRLEWSRDRGELPSNAVTRGGLLRFQASGDDQQGRYVCRAISDTGDVLATATAQLVIHFGLCCIFRKGKGI